MSTDNTAVERAIAEEQAFVTEAYASLDDQRSYYAEQLSKVRAQGGRGTPGQMSERDSFATHYEDNLLRLRNVENRLVLGRLDHTDGRTNHIGRTTLRDENQQIILTDWRATQSEPFYQATAAQPGTVLRRRHIQTRLREVVGIEDELLNEAHDNDGLNLTGEGALIAAMSKARDGKMGDIVATIQSEQDRIIRSDVNGILVVQGGPGTGKTAVALHRAAYLLYTYRERLARSGVLIIGPSHEFLRYIDQVLPALGESDVVNTTLDDILPGVRATLAEDEDVAEIKGRKIWAEIASRAVRRILQKPLRETKIIEINGKKLKLTPDMVEAAQRKARRTGKPHNEAREVYAKKLVRELGLQLAHAQKLDLDANEFLLTDIAESIDARREINLHWLPSSAGTLLERIYFFPELLDRIAPDMNLADRRRLQRDRGVGFSRADIAILDELAEHLGEFYTDAQRAQITAQAKDRRDHDEYVSQTMSSMGLGGGIVNAESVAERLYGASSGDSLAERAAADRSWTYGHVVIDEAQELSDMQWRMIARRNPAKSMTIVGDVDQRPIGAPRGGWTEALGALSTFHRVAELTISYRTPSSLLDRAQAAMTEIGFPVRPVHAVRDLPDSYALVSTSEAHFVADLQRAVAEENSYLDNEYGADFGTLAVIAPRQDVAAIRAIVQDSPVFNAQRISVIDARVAKGLEFDCVIVVEPEAVLRGGPGDLYVAMTRATRRMVVIAQGEVAPALQ